MKEPLFALLLAPFFVKSLTLVPRCGPRFLLRNRTETLAKQATFYTNLPVLDVQIMGEGGRGVVGEGRTKKGNRDRDSSGKFKSSSKWGHPLIQSLIIG